MKNAIYILSGIIFLVFMVWFVGQLRKAMDFTVKMKEFAIKRFTLKEISGWIKMLIGNPSELSIYVESYRGAIYFDGVKISDIVGTPATTIPPKGEFLLKVDYKLNPSAILKADNLKQIFEEKGTNVTTSGVINIVSKGTKMTLPFSYTDTLKNLIA